MHVIIMDSEKFVHQRNIASIDKIILVQLILNSQQTRLILHINIQNKNNFLNNDFMIVKNILFRIKY